MAKREVFLLLHGLRYPATVVAENEDGTLNLRATALNNGQQFTKSRVAEVPAKFDATAQAGEAFWSTAADLEAADKAKADAAKPPAPAPAAPPASTPKDGK